jgi:hypothetical protein
MRNGVALRALAMALALLAGAGQALTHETFSPSPESPAAPPFEANRNDILNEGFEGSWPPAGWAVIHLGSSFTWARVNTYKHTGLYSARMHYGPQGVVQDEYLVTPALDFSSIEAAYLEFYEAQNYWSGFGEHHYIAVSTTSQTDPAAFTMLVDWTPANHDIAGAIEFPEVEDPITVALHAYAGEPVVYVAFRYYGDYADDWYVDDVRIYEPFDHDIAVHSLTPDGVHFTDGGSIAPSVEVENIGSTAEDFDLTVTIAESGGEVYLETQAIHLEPGAVGTVDFPSFLASSSNYYNLRAEAVLPADESPGNNVREASCDSYTLPHVPLGWFHTNAGCGFCAPIDYEFDAWLPTQDGEVALIRCHTWWPNGADIMWLQNSAQNQQLILGYGADFTPHLWIDGVQDLAEFTGTYIPGMTARKDVLSPGSIDLHWRASDSTLVASLDLDEPLDPAGVYRLQTAVTEDSIYFAGGSGHNWHHQALRRIFPTDLSGMPIEPLVGVQSVSVPIQLASYWQAARLNATVFLQEQTGGRIWQAATGRLNTLTGRLSIDPGICETDVAEACTLRVMIAPSAIPVKGLDVTVDFDESIAELQSILPGSWVTDSGLQSYFHDYTASDSTTAHFSLAFLDGAREGSGEVARLVFTGLAEGSTGLVFLDERVRDANNTELGYGTSSGDSLHVVNDLTAVAEGPAAPAALRLLGNQPNPFNPSTLIACELPAAGRWQVTIFDAQGRRVRTLADGWLAAGRQELRWDGRDDRGAALGSGLYFVRVSGATGSVSGKLLLLK